MSIKEERKKEAMDGDSSTMGTRKRRAVPSDPLNVVTGIILCEMRILQGRDPFPLDLLDIVLKYLEQPIKMILDRAHKFSDLALMQSKFHGTDDDREIIDLALRDIFYLFAKTVNEAQPAPHLVMSLENYKAFKYAATNEVDNNDTTQYWMGKYCNIIPGTFTVDEFVSMYNYYMNNSMSYHVFNYLRAVWPLNKALFNSP